MTVLLVTGGTGFLGSYVLKALDNEENKKRFTFDTVRLLVRNKRKAEEITLENFKLEVFEGNLTNKTSLEKASVGVSHVIHIAALYDIKGSWRDFKEANIDGTANLLASLHPGTVFVLTSTYGVYGFSSNKGKPITEDFDDWKPFWHYQKSKAEQETLAWKMSKELGIHLAVVRPPNIIGPGDMPGAYNICKNLEEGNLILTRGGKGWVPVAHPTSVAWVHIELLARAKELEGEVFHVVDFHARSKDYFNAYAKALGLKPLKRSVPYPLLYIIATLLDWLPINSDITRFSIKFIGANDQLDTTKAEEKLGFRSQYDLESVISEVVEWYKSLPA